MCRDRLNMGGAGQDHGGDEAASPFELVSTQVFLDDIDAGEGGGALLYSPGSHRRYFASPETGAAFVKPSQCACQSR